MKTILLVDDNETVLDALALSVGASNLNCAVLTARDGIDAVEILKNFRVDLVLTDINMPVMDGYNLVEHRNRHCPQVPVLVMTADVSQDTKQRLNALGITECLEKPFDYASLMRMILDSLDATLRPANPAGSDIAC